MTINDFTQLDLHPGMVNTLTDLGYTTPTPIQTAVIPIMMSGKDVIGQAQTGTGKTAAFSLPVIQNLVPDQSHVQCLVLAPTRELAVQVADAMTGYGRHSGVRVLPVYGGQSYSNQMGRLKKGVDIVVGTPGRLMDLIERKVLDLGRVSTVVVDEADEMLSMGFIDDIKTILDCTPNTRQTALFSATLPKEIRQLAGRYMTSPSRIAAGDRQLTVAAVEQRYYMVNEADKVAALTRLLEGDDITRALVFARTRLGTGELVNGLTLRGYPAEALNGDLSQDIRERVLSRFRNNKIRVLVATDVAARGLDIDDISHVVNFDMPQDPEIYVHRIGRTGRAGKTGIAVSLMTPKEKWRIRRIETFTKQKMVESTLPTVEDISAKQDAALVEKMAVWLRRGRCHREREMVEQLMAQGHDPLQIAATALKLARGTEKQRPVETVARVQETPRVNPKKPKEKKFPSGKDGHDQTGFTGEKGMISLSLDTGKIAGLCVNQVVGSLSRHTDIPGRLIGRISIEKNHTLVDVPEELVSRVMAKSDNYRIGRQRVQVRRM